MNSNNDRLNSALTSTNSRRQALKLMGGGILGGAAMAAGITGVAAQRAPKYGPTGGPGSMTFDTLPNGTGAYPALTTTFVEITRFSNKGGQLTASGNYYQAGAFQDRFDVPVTDVWVTDEDGNLVASHGHNQKLASVVVGRKSDVALAQPTQGSGECQILNLALGPISLNLLGLLVEIPNPVYLNISADPDLGLLGDLLCAVNNLLNSGGLLEDLLGQLTGLLNQILGALGGL